MKTLLIATGFLLGLVLSFVSIQAHAVTDLACWDMYSKKGAKPVFKAAVVKRTTLADIALDVKAERFANFFIDETRELGDLWQHKMAITKSSLATPMGTYEASEITTKRSPYVGNNEYSFEFGKWSVTAPYGNSEGTYGGRLILPKDLSPEALKAFRIRTPQERSNAVMIYNSEYGSHTSGQIFLRMYCVSK